MKTLHDWAVSGCVDLLGLPFQEAEGLVKLADKELAIATLTYFGAVKIERARAGSKLLFWYSVLDEVGKVYGIDIQHLRDTCVWE